MTFQLKVATSFSGTVCLLLRRYLHIFKIINFYYDIFTWNFQQDYFHIVKRIGALNIKIFIHWFWFLWEIHSALWIVYFYTILSSPLIFNFIFINYFLNSHNKLYYLDLELWLKVNVFIGHTIPSICLEVIAFQVYFFIFLIFKICNVGQLWSPY